MENKLPCGNETILIVDDHETIWDFLIGFLRAKLYTDSIDKLYKENQIHEEKELEKDNWNCS